MSRGTNPDPLGQDEFLKLAEKAKSDEREHARERQQENEAQHRAR
jgi:hypothetical protein